MRPASLTCVELGGRAPCVLGEEQTRPVLLAKKSGKNFRGGIFLDFVWLTTRTPHGAYVRRARRNRIDRHGGEIERLALQALPENMSNIKGAAQTVSLDDLLGSLGEEKSLGGHVNVRQNKPPAW